MVFLANVVMAMFVVPQATEVNPAQVPENNCNLAPDVFRLAPMLLNVIVWSVDVVIKLYQTSSSGVPVHGAAAIPEFVAFCTVPAVLIQDELEVSNTDSNY